MAKNESKRDQRRKDREYKKDVRGARQDVREDIRKSRGTERAFEKTTGKRERFVKRKARQVSKEAGKEDIKGGYGRGTYRMGKKAEEGKGKEGRRSVSKRLYLKSPDAPVKEKKETPPVPQEEGGESLEVGTQTVDTGTKVYDSEGNLIGTRPGKGKTKEGKASGDVAGPSDARRIAEAAGASEATVKNVEEKYRKEFVGKQQEQKKKKGYTAFGSKGQVTDVGETKKPRPRWKSDQTKDERRERKLKSKLASQKIAEGRAERRAAVDAPYMEKSVDVKGKRKSKLKTKQKYASAADASAAYEGFKERFKGEAYEGRGFETKQRGKKLIAKSVDKMEKDKKSKGKPQYAKGGTGKRRRAPRKSRKRFYSA
jgi:hypothetical protein